jgi:hypothetical protein
MTYRSPYDWDFVKIIAEPSDGRQVPLFSAAGDRGPWRRSNVRMRTWLVLALAVGTFAQIPHAQQVVNEMTPQTIAEAIKAGDKGDVADGVINKSSGFSWGSIHIATFSTPFMRVAMAARQAKKAYQKFTPVDVTPEMLTPELQVYAWPQVNGTDKPRRDPVGGHPIYDSAATGAINVTAIVITPRKGNQEQKMAAAIHPMRFEEMTALWQNLFGADIRTLGMLAAFPLSALSEENEVHVIYDRPATTGTNGFGGTHCDDCSASFNLNKVK